MFYSNVGTLPQISNYPFWVFDGKNHISGWQDPSVHTDSKQQELTSINTFLSYIFDDESGKNYLFRLHGFP